MSGLGRPPWIAPALLAAALAAVTIGLYWPATGFEFLDLDDIGQVAANPAVMGGLTPDGVARAFAQAEWGAWIPLNWISLMADASFFGPEPRGFHLTNILLHAANMALLLLLLWRMTGSVWRSALAASLVALHPLRVESVAWITERKDVLSLFFLLLALAAYLAWTRSGKKRWYATLCALFACSLLSKPMAVTFPLLLLLLDFWPLGRALPGRGARQWLPLLREKLPLFLFAGLSALVTLAVTADWRDPLALPLRLQRGIFSPFHYLAKTVSPFALRFELLDPGKEVLQPFLLLGAGLVLAGSAWGAWRAARRFPFLAVGWGWFLVGLLPVSGLLSTGGQWVSDRFTYLPHLGLMAALAWGGERLLPAAGGVRRAAAVVAGVLLLVLAAGSFHQLFFWKDSRALWDRALSFSPENPYLHEAKGRALAREGSLAEGRKSLERALSLAPAPAPPAFYLDYGMLLVQLGEAPAALPHLEQALRGDLPPALRADGLLALGVALRLTGRGRDAITRFREALSLDPALLPARFHLATTLEEMGYPEEAAAEYREMEKRFPGSVEALAAPSSNPAFPDLVPETLERGNR